MMQTLLTDTNGKTDHQDWDYEMVVEEWYQPLYRFALGLSSNPSEASDLTQSTFETFLRKASTIRDQSKLKSWLFTILFRRYLQQKKRLHKWPNVSLEDLTNELPAKEIEQGRNADRESVMEAVASLQEKHRVPVVMFYLQEFSYKEISQVLEVPIGTVMSRLSRGKKHLRDLLAPKSMQPELC